MSKILGSAVLFLCWRCSRLSTLSPRMAVSARAKRTGATVKPPAGPLCQGRQA